jgi:hypothetical protein
MLSWLVDDSLLIVGLLAVVALGFVAAWWFTRKKQYLLGAAGAGAAALLVWLIASLVVTDRKQIEGAIRDMADAVRAHDVDRLMSHLSNDFRSPMGKSKEEARTAAKGYMDSGDVTEAVVGDFEPPEVSREKRTATISFFVKFKGKRITPDHPGFRCETTFVLDPDNQWRVKGFKLFFPPTSNEEFPVPF